MKTPAVTPSLFASDMSLGSGGKNVTELIEVVSSSLVSVQCRPLILPRLLMGFLLHGPGVRSKRERGMGGSEQIFTIRL